MNTLVRVVALSALIGAGQPGSAKTERPPTPIPRDDVQVGLMQIGDEVTRAHAFPEILYVVDGELRFSDDDAPSIARAGTVALVPENTVHVLSSPTTATVAFFRWAPEGDLAMLYRQSTMIEPEQARPATAPQDRTLRRYESATATSSISRTRTHIDDVDWTTNWTYSEELWKVYRYKPLVRDPLADWRGIGRSDVRMGLQELEPGAAYPTHHHPSPEIYMVLNGEARWSVGERRIDAGPGAVIYTSPDATHRIENIGTSRLAWLYFWWAPNGDISVLESAGR